MSVVSVALQFPPLRYFGFTPPLSSFRFCLSSESCNLILKEDEKTCRFCCGYYKISFSLVAFAKVRHEPDPSSTSIKMLLECNLLCYCWRVCNAGWLAGWLTLTLNFSQSIAYVFWFQTDLKKRALYDYHYYYYICLFCCIATCSWRAAMLRKESSSCKERLWNGIMIPICYWIYGWELFHQL